RGKEYRQAFGGYFSFFNEYGELNKDEERVYRRHYSWFEKLEKEMMSKSYKMVVLQYMLDKDTDHRFETINTEEVAPYFHNYYMEMEYRKTTDFSNKSNQKLWQYDEKGVSRLIATMPMSKWLDDDDLIIIENNNFEINFEIQK